MHSTTHKNGPVLLISHELSYTFPFSYAYLAGALKEAGFVVEVLFRPGLQADFPKFVKEILARKPLMVGLGNLYPELLPIKRLIELMDTGGRDFPIVIGGQMVSPTPEFALQITGADMGVIGEGELTMTNLARALRDGKDPASVSGMVVRNELNFINTGPGEYIKDLTELPEIPFELFPEEQWLQVGKVFVNNPQPQWRYDDRVISIHGGRGCPFRCNFCYHHSRIRYRRIEDMMQEAQEWLKRFDGNMLMFSDDLVLATPKRAEKLVELVSGLDRKVDYRITCRFDVLSKIDDHLLREMKRTGLRIMALGIESGSQRILDIMDKRITVDQIRDGVRRLAENGIFASGNFMFGQISETREDGDASIALMQDLCKLHKHIQLSSTIATPFPGSGLCDYALEKGLIKDQQDLFDRFNSFVDISVNLSDMSDEELLDLKRQFDTGYREARTNSSGAMTAMVENSIRRLGGLDMKLRRRLFSDHPETPPSWYSNTYDLAQRTLGKLQLSLRGISRFETI
ncbi:B12-binding domain-containing radical SAM protein [Pseudodesulfovibrio piezophilus]|uniref:Radical SAM domain protein n=1 Tax=Pseudodesulfovibrio piezophilus (strain DSM 21447 / JCM 15486 / C1TLV30) TaxID=1322246 RepID=M1WWT3_PSEP2